MASHVHDHLTEVDRFTVTLEQDPQLRATIVAVAVFDRAPDWGILRDRIERATRLAPRFRMILASPPLRLAPPRWLPTADFDLDWHLRRERIRRGGGMDDVLTFARNAGMEAFDHERPLWIFTLLDGLPGRRAALVMKVHHALTDGIGGIQIAEHVVDLQREPSPLGPMPPLPEPPSPGVADQVLEPLGFHARRALDVGRDLVATLPRVTARALRHPPRAVAEAVGTTEAVLHFVRPVTRTLSPVMVDRSLLWRYQTLDVPFEPLARAAHSLECTLNDVFLSSIAGGMRRYHEAHGAPVDRLRLSMPISMRTSEDPAGGNRVTIARFEIPVGIEHPAVRTVEISQRCRHLRSDPALPLSNQIAGVLNLLPVAVVGTMLKHVDFLASNVPGFPVEVFVGGARVESFHAFGPTTGSAANITLMSYDGTCHIGVNTDERAVTDPDVFLACLSDGFDEVMAIVER